MDSTIFLDWFTSNGGFINPLAELHFADSYCLRVKLDGRSIVPDEDESASRIIFCPHRLTISFLNARESLLLQCLKGKGFSQTIVLRLFLIEQYLLGKQSFWYPYIQCLPSPECPSEFHTPVWWEPDELAWLQGTNLGKAAAERKKGWQHEYHAASKILRDHNTLAAWERWTWDLYLWAATMLSSRSFTASALSDPTIDSPVLIPGLDMLNHSENAKVDWEFGSDGSIIKTEEVIEAGDEIFNNYGPKSNAELMIGYGFCKPDTGGDSIDLGFNAATSKAIRNMREQRHMSELDADWDGIEQHCVYFDSSKPPQTAEPMEVAENRMAHKYSSRFLTNFSIAVENGRERDRDGCKWARSQDSFKAGSEDLCKQFLKEHPYLYYLCLIERGGSSDIISRNKLHVVTAIYMLLENSISTILENTISLQDPDSMTPSSRYRYQLASTYRSGQLAILTGVLMELRGMLQALLNDHSSIIRLEYMLNDGPKALRKDFRSLIHVALGSRDPVKIQERGGEECALTLWLYGFVLLDNRKNLINKANESDRPLNAVRKWICSMEESYGMPIEGEIPARDSTNEDIFGVVQSYHEAIGIHCQKHSDSLYSDPLLKMQVLYWCLHVVREEGVRFPNVSRSDAGASGRDELVFCLAGD